MLLPLHLHSRTQHVSWYMCCNYNAFPCASRRKLHCLQVGYKQVLLSSSVQFTFARQFATDSPLWQLLLMQNICL